MYSVSGCLLASITTPGTGPGGAGWPVASGSAADPRADAAEKTASQSSVRKTDQLETREGNKRFGNMAVIMSGDGGRFARDQNLAVNVARNVRSGFERVT